MPSDMQILDSGFFYSLFEQVNDEIYIIDPVTSLIIEANKEGCDALGMSRKELLNQSVLSLNKDVIGLSQWAEISDAIKTAGDFTFVGRHKRKDGSDFPVEIRTSYFQYNGTPYFVSIARDTSLRSQHEYEFHNDDAIRAFALNEASDGLWDWNILDNSLFLSPQWYRMMGYGPHEISAPSLSTWNSAVHPDDAERVTRLLQEHLNSKSSRYEAKYRLRNRNGDYLWVHDRGLVVKRDSDNKALRMIGLVLDITQSQLLAEQLFHHSQRDDLTGLYNRKTGYELFGQYLNVSIQQNTQMQIVMLDIDNFKLINENYGHLNGDKAIQHFAKTVPKLLRKTDLLFRWGGEEFLLLCPDTAQDTALNLINRLLKQLSQHPFLTEDNRAVFMTASAGISGYPHHGSCISDLVKSADGAMYQAKAEGKDKVCISA
ncbi:sensor domain-containing diguanylate cyclase [Neptunomonas qingdaonensis]|uniref:PAS domain S-box-containing protein/diguanylate cyclase (GGDEF) domain-containing protein n=1 Tax=Neptunomonas qingdaonensis TaxID=1045558 RepID=A0A1I2R0W7_9GAMM|nr:sensor domain-containing diguanylate cyclase [Neptunomonas qingdaonensis]SFG33950.1 PAS domain S-box-containing protein/diguanylate cyclase (GGDEF) domain-containing protein [Neptunomonas qingdaonensis]